MATIGLTLVLKGAGQLFFGGEPKSMITEELGLSTGSSDLEVFDGIIIFQHIDIAAAIIAIIMVASLAFIFRTGNYCVKSVGRANPGGIHLSTWRHCRWVNSWHW